jgi:hypothetical protein
MAKEKFAQSKHRRHNDRNGAKPKKADQYRIKKLCFLVQYLIFSAYIHKRQYDFNSLIINVQWLNHQLNPPATL